MSRVLLLDIDGVLTSARAHAALMPVGVDALAWHHFDPVAIGFLNQLLAKFPDLEFVLSSSWRKSFNIQTMTMMLSQAGWRGTWHSVWKTPESSKKIVPTCVNGYLTRGEEIQLWLDDHRPDHYLILDDDTSILENQRSHWVQTDENDGINTLAMYKQMLTILKKKSVYYRKKEGSSDDD